MDTQRPGVHEKVRQSSTTGEPASPFDDRLFGSHSVGGGARSDARASVGVRHRRQAALSVETPLVALQLVLEPPHRS